MIKSRPTISGWKKRRLAKLVEVTGRKSSDGTPIVPALLGSLNAVLVAVLGAEEDEGADVTLAVLVTAPYKLKKQKKVKADGETTKFITGSTIARDYGDLPPTSQH